MSLRSILLALIACSVLGCSDFVTEKYSKFDEATKAGAVARGWLPAFIPRSATDITLVNDLDTNHQWLKFRIPASEVSEMTKGMNAITIAEARESVIRKPTGIGTWPPELNNTMVATPRALYRFYLTTVATGPICIAVDSGTGEVFGWTCKGGS